MKPTPFRLHSRRRGVALVLVLAFIALLSGLLIAFFSTTSATRREAAQFEAGVTVNQLSDMATNIIIGQIFDATRSWEVPAPNSVNKGSGLRLTYATQPGMVRTYDSNGGVGRAFKLYSSDTMVTRAGSEWVVSKELVNEVPTGWPGQPALFVDLNAPVLTPDPEGDIIPAGTTQKYIANYPILDPSGLSPSNRMAGTGSTQDGIEGFNLTNVPGYGGRQANNRPQVIAGTNPQVIPAKNTTGNPAPMPVQWLYVLQNGTMTSPADVSDNGLVADWSNLPEGSPNKPSQANPIVGRIAFWTDDDTAKLNPNVHSEGVAWDRAINGADIPNSPYGEKQLRERQPVRGEYQRYPGHPATVSLSPLLGIIPQYQVPVNDSVTGADYGLRLLPYYNMIPRIGGGGSMGGTAVTYDQNVGISDVVRDRDRLFATPDEMFFSVNYNGATPSARLVNPNVKRKDIEKMKFFMTTTARSAEVNLLNQPRLGLWMPQQEVEPNKGKGGGPLRARNAQDELLAFCSTLGGYSYYFERYSIFLREQVNDRAKHTGIPAMQLPQFGYQGPSSQSTSLDWMPRNQVLYKYLQTLTETPLPGFGGKITDRYPAAQRDQILTEMVDLLRLSNSYALNSDPSLRYEYAPARQMPDAVSGETQIVPLVPNTAVGQNTKGFGRFPTVTEAMFVCYDSTDPTKPVTPGQPPRKMRILLALEPYTPNAGSWTWSPLARYVVRGLETVAVDKVKGLFSADPAWNTNLVTSRCGYGSGGNHNTAHTGTFANFRYWVGSGKDATKRIPNPVIPTGVPPSNYEEVTYPWVSIEVPFDPTKKTFELSSGVITVEVHSGYATTASADSLVQTLQFQLPTLILPQPRDAGTDWNYQNRIDADKFNLVNGADTVRSLQVDPMGPSKGDLRIVAGLKTVPSNFFICYNGGNDPSGYAAGAPIIHSFRNGDGTVVNGGRMESKLVAAGPKNKFITAHGMQAALMSNNQPGDWDNAPYGFLDGAYINKPDDYYGSAQGDWYNAPTNTPNRQISSAVVFGSLPVGVSSVNAAPWQTLVFSPNPAAGNAHPALTTSFAPGGKRVRDHLFLDFFTMPIVEPFAESEPLSSQGKVNLNYQIAPFSYITRSTALNGMLKSTRIIAVPTGGAGGMQRRAIDPTETLKGFEERFNDPSKGGMFRSASEICDMHLVPQSATLATAKSSWWVPYQGTGDNSREAPYGQIYARATTKSNSFTVHMRVQTLRKRPGDNAAQWAVWREGIDNMTGEYRGSTTIERYVDLSDKRLVDFASRPDATLDTFYKFRVVQTKRFNP